MVAGMMLGLLLLVGCREPLMPVNGPVGRSPVGAWERVLKRSVDAKGDVDYALVRKERDTLAAYLNWIRRRGAVKGKTGAATHGFWLNAFNALVIWQVVERDLEALDDVPSLLPWTASGFYAGTAFEVSGNWFSLWEMGHERVTHVQQDYRDFGALAIGARSGPPVPNFVFEGETLGRQLDEQMNRFMMSDRALYFEGDTLWVNPMFERYGVELDLYTHGMTVCDLGEFHTTGKRRERLKALASEGCPSRTFAFDWRLNASGEGP